jgi:hypothetical protein
MERVLFSEDRDANPFFHVMEAIWMLNGGQDAEWPCLFNKSMKKYANKDGNYDGAYGYRWRTHFGVDQIKAVVQELTDYPDSRRAVIGMYDPTVDHDSNSNDIPCNLCICFAVRSGKLTMTVYNRSNDAIWGAYGANAVHMSMLQEVVAGMVGILVGEYTQVSNNFHLYTDMMNHKALMEHPRSENMYSTMGWYPFPLVSKPDHWLDDCAKFMKDPTATVYVNNWFYYVARPMFLAWKAHKAGETDNAMSWVGQIEDPAWSYACTQWLLRRYVK